MGIAQEEMRSAQLPDSVTKLELLEKLQEMDRVSSLPSAPQVEYRNIKTICLFLSTLGIGMVAAVAGTTLIQTRLMYDVTTATMSVALTMESCGCLVGVFVCSWLIGRLKFEFILGCSVTLSALMTICASFLPVFPAFIAAVTVRGFAAGLYLLNSQSFCVEAWKGHRRRAMITQAQNAVWSLGAFISPFVMKPFLIEIAQLRIVNDINMTSSASMTTDHFVRLYSHLDDVTSTGNTVDYQYSPTNEYTNVSLVIIDSFSVELQMVRSAYVTTGLLSLTLVLPTLAMYFYANGVTLPCRQRQHKLNNLDVGHLPWTSGTSRWPARSALFYVIVVFCIGILYGGLELTPRSFFTSFVVRYLSWTVNDATLLLSVFYATFGAGRLLAVPLSTVISPTIMLTFNIIFIGMGLGILLMIDFVVDLSPIFVWISSGLLGFGLSSSFACLVLVASSTRPETNVHRRRSLSSSITLSALGIGCNIGAILFPVLVGYLFDNRSPMWMVYLPICAAMCQAGLLLVRYSLSRL